MQAIRAARAGPPNASGWRREVGTVEKGKLADLVVVDGDPLADVAILQNPENIALVIKGGEIAANRLERTEGQRRTAS